MVFICHVHIVLRGAFRHYPCRSSGPFPEEELWRIGASGWVIGTFGSELEWVLEGITYLECFIYRVVILLLEQRSIGRNLVHISYKRRILLFVLRSSRINSIMNRMSGRYPRNRSNWGYCISKESWKDRGCHWRRKSNIQAIDSIGN